MSAIDETWDARADCVYNAGGDGEMIAEVVRTESLLLKRDDVTLIAAAPDMFRVLRAIEWSRIEDFGGVGEPAGSCPDCWGLEKSDAGEHCHQPDCGLAAALRKAAYP